MAFRFSSDCSIMIPMRWFRGCRFLTFLLPEKKSNDKTFSHPFLCFHTSAYRLRNGSAGCDDIDCFPGACRCWDRGNRHTYSLGQIACDRPGQFILLSHDLDISEKIIAELTSLLVRRNIKYDYRVETENVKDITVFLRNHSAVTPEQARYRLRVKKAITNLEKKRLFPIRGSIRERMQKK